MRFDWNGARIWHAVYTFAHARALQPLFETFVAALTTSDLRGVVESWSSGPNSVRIVFDDGRPTALYQRRTRRPAATRDSRDSATTCCIVRSRHPWRCVGMGTGRMPSLGDF